MKEGCVTKGCLWIFLTLFLLWAAGIVLKILGILLLGWFLVVIWPIWLLLFLGVVMFILGG